MSSFEVIVTPEMVLEKWLVDMDKLFTPLTPIDTKSFNVLAHFNSHLQKVDLYSFDLDQLTGPLFGKLLYQYSAVVGQLEIHARLAPHERMVFLERSKEALQAFIDRIEHNFMLNPMKTYFD